VLVRVPPFPSTSGMAGSRGPRVHRRKSMANTSSPIRRTDSGGPREPPPASGAAFCYVDTRRSLGHYGGDFWMDPALVGGAGGS
jgi:hypothetical protein